MKRQAFKLGATVLAIFVVVVLAYVSLLGENNKASKIVFMYLDNISKRNYESNIQFCTREYIKSFNAVDDPVTHQFSLETALLNHFGLIDNFKYLVDVQRSNFWMPLSGTDKVSISVRIRPQENEGFFKRLFLDHQRDYIYDLFELKREGGQWKIDQINVEASVLAENYQSTKKTMSDSKYIAQNEDGIIIKENYLDLEKLTSMDRRIITFNLNKVLNLLSIKEQTMN